MIRILLLCLSLSWAHDGYAGGSWGNRVGGSLMHYFRSMQIARLFKTQTFVAAEFYRVYKHAGLGVEHEFIGVRTHWLDQRGAKTARLFTTGLVASGDDQYFRDHLDKGSTDVLYLSRIDDVIRFESVVKNMNLMMKRHPANVSCRLTFRMFATPIFGQPCTNAVNDLIERLSL
jgi:hypothetical protein